MSKSSNLLITFFFGIFLFTSSHAWEGYNEDMGSYFSIESFEDKNKRSGAVIYFDYISGEKKSGVINLNEEGSGTLKDNNSGQTYKVHMN